MAGVGPQGTVDGDAASPESRDGPGDVAGAVIDAVLVRWRMVDELAADLPTEHRVLAGVEDEGVPADVH